jgi:hypothetical protein
VCLALDWLATSLNVSVEDEMSELVSGVESRPGGVALICA